MGWSCGSFDRPTARYDDPDEIHEEIVAPEIVSFGATVGQPFVVVVKHAGCVVQNITVDLAYAHYR